MDKIDRMGLYREDGKAYKMHAIATLDEKALRLPSKIHDAVRVRIPPIEFPQPDPPLKRGGQFEPLVQLDGVAAGFTLAPPWVLSGVTAQLTARAKVALVGPNGAGKSTLLGLLHGALQPVAGSRSVSPGVSFGFVAQHHAETLPLQISAAAFLSDKFSVPEFEARSRLGKLGISGSQALTPMGSLSAGQRVRVSLTVGPCISRSPSSAPGPADRYSYLILGFCCLRPRLPAACCLAVLLPCLAFRWWLALV